MSRLEDRGFRTLVAQEEATSASSAPSAPSTSSTGGVTSAVTTVLMVVIGVPVAIVVVGGAYMLYKANAEPDDVRPEDGERALEAFASGDQAGAVVETLAVAKNRKTMKTPLGFRVPNLARFMLPEAEQTRAIGSVLSGGSSKGISQ